MVWIRDPDPHWDIRLGPVLDWKNADPTLETGKKRVRKRVRKRKGNKTWNGRTSKWNYLLEGMTRIPGPPGWLCTALQVFYLFLRCPGWRGGRCTSTPISRLTWTASVSLQICVTTFPGERIFLSTTLIDFSLSPLLVQIILAFLLVSLL